MVECLEYDGNKSGEIAVGADSYSPQLGLYSLKDLVSGIRGSVSEFRSP